MKKEINLNRSISKSRKTIRIIAPVLMWVFAFYMPNNKVYAADPSTLTTLINGWAHGGTGTLSASVTGTVVSVTGTVTGATNQLTLDIDPGVKIDWKANLTGSTASHLLSLSGIGEFNLSEGQVIQEGEGRTINSTGTSGTVTISGGTVKNSSSSATLYMSGASSSIVVSGTGKVIQSAEGYAVYTFGKIEVKEQGQITSNVSAAVYNDGADLSVTVSGGTITSESGRAIYIAKPNVTVNITGGIVSTGNNIAVDIYGTNSSVNISGGTVKNSSSSPTIHMRSDQNKGLNVMVSGGQVKQEGTGVAIRTFGNTEISGSAEVSATSGRTVYAEGLTSTVVVKGGTVRNNSTSYATIHISNAENTGLNFVASGTGKVIQEDSYIAVHSFGSIEVKDNAELNAINGRAIYVEGTTSKVTVSGGTVKSASSGPNIYLYNNQNKGLNVVVSGSAKVIQDGTGNNISTFGSVEVKDEAEVTVKSGYAIRVMDSGTVTVTGGTLSTSSGRAISAEGAGSKIIVYGGTVTATSGGIAINLAGANAIAYHSGGWVGQVNTSGDNSIFVRNTDTNVHFITGSKTGLTALPVDAVVYWDIVGGKSGISYERNTNEGFLEISGISVLNENCTVNVTKPGNGSITVSNGTTPITEFPATIKSLTTLNLTALPDEGYELLEWWDGNKQAERSLVLTGDITISATFKPFGTRSFTVTFVLNNGNPSFDKEVIENEKVAKPAPDPERDGYKFKGWFLDNNEFNFDTPITANITLVAKWEGIDVHTKYIVTFDFDYGNKVETVEVLDGNTVDKPEDPAREGYRFEGWFNGATEFNFSTPITTNITLKAKWTAVTGSEDVLTFNLNIYPNPFTNVLHVEGADGCILQVFNGNGGAVYSQKIENADQTVHLEHLPAGLYLFKIHKNNQIKTLKIMKN